jgi:hypothetical protein
LPAKSAGKVVRAMLAGGGDDVVAAAGLPITEHSVVVQRCAAAVKKINDALEQARRTGILNFFNAT